MTLSRVSSTFGSRGLSVVIATAILVASVVPVPTTPPSNPGMISLTDPFHLVGYAALAAALAATLPNGTRSKRDAVVGSCAVIVIVTAYGFGIELLQASLSWRTFAVADAAVNAVGAVVGIAVRGVVGPVVRIVVGPAVRFVGRIVEH